jgi:hypothetical protein
MNITREQLLKIIKEEYAAVNELGPETGHEEGTDALDIVKEIGYDLIELGDMMNKLPSHRTASEFGNFIAAKGEEAKEAHAELFKRWSDGLPESIREEFKGHDPHMVSYIDKIKQLVLDGEKENKIDPELAQSFHEQITSIYSRMREYEN